jgi:hypothetical protein
MPKSAIEKKKSTATAASDGAKAPKAPKPSKSPTWCEKEVKSLEEQAADAVVRQCIKQGKAQFIIDELQKDDKANEVLHDWMQRSFRVKSPRVVTVLLISADSAPDGTFVHLPLNGTVIPGGAGAEIGMPRWFALLLKEHESEFAATMDHFDDPSDEKKKKVNKVLKEAYSTLGGPGFQWQEIDEAVEWAQERLTGCSEEVLMKVLHDLEVVDPADLEENEATAEEWYADNTDDVAEVLNERFLALFDHQELTKRALTKRQLESYRLSGIGVRPVATILIEEANWG